MGKLVSIVLPTYNRASLLPVALESCLAQTYQDLEVVVVDDGSKDETGQVVEEFAARDPRVRYIRQDNQRLPAALNTGHRYSRGDYLTWTSDDNLYEPDAIAIMAGYLDDHPEIGFVCCDLWWEYEDGRVIRIELPEPAALQQGQNAVMACFMYRREVYALTGEYNREMELCEDVDYWMRVWCKFPMAKVPDAVPYRVKMHSGALTRVHRGKIPLVLAKVHCRHMLPRREHRARYAQAYFEASWLERQNGRPLPAFRYALGAVCRRPGRLEYWRNMGGALLSAAKRRGARGR